MDSLAALSRQRRASGVHAAWGEIEDGVGRLAGNLLADRPQADIKGIEKVRGAAPSHEIVATAATKAPATSTALANQPKPGEPCAKVHSPRSSPRAPRPTTAKSNPTRRRRATPPAGGRAQHTVVVARIR